MASGQLDFLTEDPGGHPETGGLLLVLFQVGGMLEATPRPEEAAL